MSLISIITVNFNQHEATWALLNSIYSYYSHANIEIILVDNGSDFDYKGYFEKDFPAIRYIRSPKNLGFAGGNNLGILASGGEYLFFVNNDTEFTPGLLETLTDTLDENPDIGILSPKINYYDDKKIIQYAGFTPMNYYTCRNECVGQFEVDNGQYDNLVQATGYIHGAAMMLRREALTKAGPMPENFFLYYEEMDWCERIRKAGFQIWVNTNAIIYHKESLSVGKNSALKEYFMNRNRILFIRRNAQLHQRLLFYIYFLVLVAPRNCIKYIIAGTPKFISTLFSAIVWNMLHKPSSMSLGFKLKN